MKTQNAMERWRLDVINEFNKGGTTLTKQEWGDFLDKLNNIVTAMVSCEAISDTYCEMCYDILVTDKEKSMGGCAVCIQNESGEIN